MRDFGCIFPFLKSIIFELIFSKVSRCDDDGSLILGHTWFRFYILPKIEDILDRLMSYDRRTSNIVGLCPVLRQALDDIRGQLPTYPTNHLVLHTSDVLVKGGGGADA